MKIKLASDYKSPGGWADLLKLDDEEPNQHLLFTQYSRENARTEQEFVGLMLEIEGGF